jgi:fluoroacetyl-CoA thioesterase
MMSFQGPKVFEKTYVVTDGETIHFLGPEVTPGLSTPSLVTWMELISRDNAAPLLNLGEDTVGVSVEIKHLAPTPVGMKVRVVSKLQSVAGRIYSFAIEAFDEVEKIGEGTHVRASINVAKFGARIAAKEREGSRHVGSMRSGHARGSQRASTPQ